MPNFQKVLKVGSLSKHKHILFLGYSDAETQLIRVLRDNGLIVSGQKNEVTDLSNYDLVVSFGYTKILSEKTLATAKTNPINLHISLLPYNRGMHPNFWAHYDSTPSGVSIHYINQGIDTGDILLQKEVIFGSNEKTFRQTWSRLKREIEELFIRHIKELVNHKLSVIPQKNGGTFHLKSDLPKEFLGWDCEINSEIKRLKQVKLE